MKTHSQKTLRALSAGIVCALLLPAQASAINFKKMMVVGAVATGGYAVVKNVTANQSQSAPFVMEGKVIHVDDGDTIKLLLPDHQTKNIRLTDIDAPESEHGNNRPGQRFSRVSKESLANMIKGKLVTAQCYDTDIYKRSVCRIYLGNVDVNMEQVRRGMAWVNLAHPKSVREKSAFSAHEQAKQQRIGLWADESPVEPWHWRQTCWKQSNCSGAGS